MQLREALNAGNSKQPTGQPAASPRIRGLLLLYVIALVPFLLHTAVLTVGSMVSYTHPAAAGLHSRVPLGFLIYYVISNVALLVYGIVLFILMIRRRRSAIANNVIFNILAVVFLLSWHLFGEKSTIGTGIDSVPNLLGAVYVLMSTRVRSTFIVRRPPR
jgi:hypothetical protein